MKIPLNINLQQIFLHLFNFSLLTMGLYFLLYKPVMDFIKKRTEYYRQLDNNAREKLTKAEELESSYQQCHKNIETELDEKRQKLTQETDQSINAMLNSAIEHAEKIVSDGEEAARQERLKILEDARQEIALMAIAATEKLLSKSLSGTLDQFLDTVKKE